MVSGAVAPTAPGLLATVGEVGQGLTAVDKSGEPVATASRGGVQGQFVGEVYNECQRTT
jgi:hypothetical protein